MTEHRTTARSYGALLILTLIVSGCASAREKRDREIAEADLGRVPHGEVLTWDDKPIGEYLTELNLRMERYFALKTRTDARSVQVREVLETEIERYVAKREDELIFELSQGPPKNRVVAAAALGFSRTEQALGPLLAAVDDPSLEVHRQAVLGLGLLADPATPIEPLTDILRTDADDVARTNASFALFRLVRAGVDDERIAPALRLALLDEEPGVRAQAAVALGVLVDGDSVNDLAALLDDEPFVYSAGSRALMQIARDNKEEKGAVARAFVDAWEAAEDERKDRLRRDLTQLANTDYGKRAEDWKRWAYGLP